VYITIQAFRLAASRGPAESGNIAQIILWGRLFLCPDAHSSVIICTVASLLPLGEVLGWGLRPAGSREVCFPSSCVYKSSPSLPHPKSLSLRLALFQVLCFRLFSRLSPIISCFVGTSPLPDHSCPSCPARTPLRSPRSLRLVPTRSSSRSALAPRSTRVPCRTEPPSMKALPQCCHWDVLVDKCPLSTVSA
jgi:hypothetical protein